jgi:isopentenyl-diphosphate delta-isomerase
MDTTESVVLVDTHDTPVGTLGRVEAHRGSGRLHRAISVILYRKNRGATLVLLQKRSAQKSLWPNCWTNTVCSHPRIGESPRNCAVRRLSEELRIDIRPEDLSHAFKMEYQAAYGITLSEHELDHVFVGSWSGNPVPNRREVSNVRWVPWDDVIRETTETPDVFTPWFCMMVGRIELIRLFRGQA